MLQPLSDGNGAVAKHVGGATQFAVVPTVDHRLGHRNLQDLFLLRVAGGLLRPLADLGDVEGRPPGAFTQGTEMGAGAHDPFHVDAHGCGADVVLGALDDHRRLGQPD